MELPYDSIGFGAGTLAISFKAGDIAALEKSFRDAGQNIQDGAIQDFGDVVSGMA